MNSVLEGSIFVETLTGGREIGITGCFPQQISDNTF